MKGYVLSPAAERDLDAIWDYTSKKWGLSQAERYIRIIQDTVIGLAAGTQVSQSAEDIRAGYRKALVGMHVLFFKTTPDMVDVIRILHQQMDLPSRLHDPSE
jgi:toxin ParE1/3/4